MAGGNYSIQRINFLEKKPFALTYRNMTVIGGALVAFCLLLYGVQFTRSLRLDKRKQVLSMEVQTLNKEKELFMRAVASASGTAALSETRTVLLGFLDHSISWPAVLRELSVQAPASLWLTTVTCNEKGAVLAAPVGNKENQPPATATATASSRIDLAINGQAVQAVSIASFVKSLSTSPYFKNVNLTSIQQVKNPQGDVYQFVVELTVVAGKKMEMGSL